MAWSLGCKVGLVESPVPTPWTTVSSTCGLFLGARPSAHSPHLNPPNTPRWMRKEPGGALAQVTSQEAAAEAGTRSLACDSSVL